MFIRQIANRIITQLQVNVTEAAGSVFVILFDLWRLGIAKKPSQLRSFYLLFTERIEIET